MRSLETKRKSVSDLCDFFLHQLLILYRKKDYNNLEKLVILFCNHIIIEIVCVIIIKEIKLCIQNIFHMHYYHIFLYIGTLLYAMISEFIMKKICAKYVEILHKKIHITLTLMFITI